MTLDWLGSAIRLACSFSSAASKRRSSSSSLPMLLTTIKYISVFNVGLTRGWSSMDCQMVSALSARFCCSITEPRLNQP